MPTIRAVALGDQQLPVRRLGDDRVDGRGAHDEPERVADHAQRGGEIGRESGADQHLEHPSVRRLTTAGAPPARWFRRSGSPHRLPFPTAVG